MRRILGAMLLGAAIAAPFPAWSQQADGQQIGQPPAGAQQPGAVPAYLTDTEADLEAITAARIAALRTVLQLTAEQAPLFEPVEAELRKSIDAAQSREAARFTQAPPATFLVVLERIAAAETARSADITAFVAAFKPLADTLTDEQMRRVPPFLGLVDLPYGEQPSSQLWIVSE